MIAYEFFTQVAQDGRLVVPVDYRQKLPVGSSVRVVVLVDAAVPPKPNGQDALKSFPTLEEVVKQIRATPPNPNNISGSNAQLAERLLHPVTEAEATFDLASWQAEWRQVEATMKADSLAHEASERAELAQ